MMMWRWFFPRVNKNKSAPINLIEKLTGEVTLKIETDKALTMDDINHPTNPQDSNLYRHAFTSSRHLGLMWWKVCKSLQQTHCSP